MRLFFIFVFVLLILVPKGYAGFRVSIAVAPTSSARLGGVAAASSHFDEGKHKRSPGTTRFYRGHRYWPNNVLGLIAFIFSIIGATAWVLFFKMLKGAATLPWQFLVAGTLFGVLALVLGLNTPRSYFYDFGILAVVLGFVEAIPLLPLFLVFALIAWLVYLPKRPPIH